ncbi:CoA transferase [Candidatus Poriferisocius sp.]|uniref:CoA transferase n=1 Tax=Candidatus Poriferisocius sp. TaxID=3101276 RepID=UPI003B5B8688
MTPDGTGLHPALVWAQSGLMALSGPEDGPPAVASGRWVQRLDEVVADIARLRAQATGNVSAPGGVGRPEISEGPSAGLRTDAAGFLGERAALVGRRRRGAVSVGGACRMVAAADGVLAVSLARTSDVEMVPAWLQRDVPPGADVWAAVVDGARRRPMAELLERAGWLGLAVGEAARPPAPAEPHSFADAGSLAPGRRLVVDTSSLWAGPLCASLLGGRGTAVTKVEGPNRPDGARYGSPAFFELMNRGKQHTIIDLEGAEGQARFGELCRRAAVVVDGLRPRVWANWGIDRLEVARTCGLLWVSITAHGDDRPGFGDDAAVAGGLWLADPHGGLPWFVADAAADPVAGLVACRAVLEAMAAGRAGLIEVAMSTAVSWLRAGDDLTAPDAEVFRRGDRWVVRADDDEQVVLDPQMGPVRPVHE